MLPSGFYGDVKSLFGQLSSPGALGRACDAAVRAALPCLGDVRKLLEVRSQGPRRLAGLLKMTTVDTLQTCRVIYKSFVDFFRKMRVLVPISGCGLALEMADGGISHRLLNRASDRLPVPLPSPHAPSPPQNVNSIGPYAPRQIVDDRLRSFDGVGARVQRLMLERLGAIFARLRTFELLEGGRDLSSSRSGGAPPLLVVGDGSGACTVASTGDRQEDVDSREAAGEIAGGSEGDCSAFSEPTLRESGSSGGGGGGVDEETEVARWLQFRTTDLASFVGGALQVGDVQAAAVVWRRHGRTDRGAGRPVKRNTRTATAAGRGGESEEGAEGRRLEMVLPAQLATLPARAPPTLLGTWLRDEVLPALDVAGALAVSAPPKVCWTTADENAILGCAHQVWS